MIEDIAKDRRPAETPSASISGPESVGDDSAEPSIVTWGVDPEVRRRLRDRLPHRAWADDRLPSVGRGRASFIVARDGVSRAIETIAAYPERVEVVAFLAPARFETSDDLEVVAALSRAKKLPILVACGTDQPDVRAKVGAIRQALPGATIVFVYATGDDLDRERPEAVAALLATFLTRREQFLVSNDDGRRFP